MPTSLYKITHTASGKMYFGVAKDVAKRWSRHRSVTWGKHGGCPYLHAALMLYGLEAFTFEVVAVYQTTDEALAAEREHIAEYRTNEREFGYNLTNGGDYAPTNGPEKTKKQWDNPEVRARMVEGIKRGWADGDNKRRRVDSMPCKSVVCVETGEEFKSISAAAASVGVSMKAVSSALHGKCKTAGGHQWAFVGTDISTFRSTEEIRVEKAENRAVSKRKRIICVDTGEEFESLLAAANRIGKRSASISDVLRGKRPRAGGFRWAYKAVDTTEEST